MDAAECGIRYDGGPAPKMLIGFADGFIGLSGSILSRAGMWDSDISDDPPSGILRDPLPRLRSNYPFISYPNKSLKP